MNDVIDAKRLRKLEGIIDRGMKSFVEVGNALAEIQRDNLYRETHKTFAAYVEDRFGFKKSRAYQLIEAASVADEMSTMVDKLPNERQARELAKAPPEEREEIWEDVVDSEPEPTAKAVRERVESRKDQARQTRQQVKDSEAAERVRIERWAETIDTFENKVIAIKAAIDRLDKQQFAVVQMMFE